MSTLNCLSDCCPTTPPPEECCIELSDLSTLFPSGVGVSVGGTSLTFSPGGWYKEGCCLRNTSISGGGSLGVQCTSDWTYETSETIKCIQRAKKKKTVTTSFDPTSPELPDLCALNECPDIVIAFESTGSVMEKGERVVASKLSVLSATITVGKFLRTCEYGTSECVFVVGLTVTFSLQASGITQGYKTFTRTLDFVNADILQYCSNGATLEELAAGFNVNRTEGSNDFPLCNYISLDSTPGELLTVSRVKVLTNLNCPLTFTDDDDNPQFCDQPFFCLAPTTEQGPITVTFNRTLPPVYVGIEPYTYGTVVECCATAVLNTFPNPKQMWEVVGPATITIDPVSWTYDPPPPGQQHIDSCFVVGLSQDCTVGLLTCYGLFLGCWLPYPENTVFIFVIQCGLCSSILTPTLTFYNQTFSDHSFSYTSVTDPTPITHTHNIPAWTLNC